MIRIVEIEGHVVRVEAAEEALALGFASLLADAVAEHGACVVDPECNPSAEIPLTLDGEVVARAYLAG